MHLRNFDYSQCMSRLPSGDPASSDSAPSPPQRISMRMGFEDAREIAAWLASHRGAPAAVTVKDTLWLRAVFLKAQKGLSPAERSAFLKRADRLLLRIGTCGAAVTDESALACACGKTASSRTTDEGAGAWMGGQDFALGSRTDAEGTR